jgi:hypothetical protein
MGGVWVIFFWLGVGGECYLTVFCGLGYTGLLVEIIFPEIIEIFGECGIKYSGEGLVLWHSMAAPFRLFILEKY